MRRFVKTCIDAPLRPFGLEIRYKRSVGLGYIRVEETLSAARKAGVTLEQYLEQIWGYSTIASQVVNEMSLAGVFDKEDQRILEIGAGTGLYMGKVLEVSGSRHYESYETSSDWANYLHQTHRIQTRNADGETLNETKDNSIDLVQAHGVFVYLPFLSTYRYWKEIFRVCSKTSYVVFDVFSESCLEPSDVDLWLKSGQTYPCFLSYSYVKQLFAENGYELVNRFFVPYGASRSEYLIFRRD